MSELMQRLVIPFVPPETRFRLRQQRLDGEAARLAPRVLGLRGVEVSVVDCVVGRGSWREVSLVPTATFPHMSAWWFTRCKLSWDGSRLIAQDGADHILHWQPQAGGVKPDFRAEEVARAGRRPVTSGECPARVVELAAVGLLGRKDKLRRLYLLDEESRRLAVFPARGLAEDRIAALANAAGVVFRTYGVSTGGRVSPDELCGQVLFPPSARRQRLMTGLLDEDEWRR